MPRVIVASATRCTREPVGGEPHRQASAARAVSHVSSKARLDDVVQLRVHLGLLPEVLLEALHPLEVRDDDAAGVREHVGEDRARPCPRGSRRRPASTGPFAPSQMIDALTWSAFSSVITCSSAHGASTLDVEQEQLLVRDLLCVLRRPRACRARCLCANAAATSIPLRIVKRDVPSPRSRRRSRPPRAAAARGASRRCRSPARPRVMPARRPSRFATASRMQ